MGMEQRTFLLVFGVEWVDEAVGVFCWKLVLEVRRVVLLSPLTGMYGCYGIQSKRNLDPIVKA